ncbi:MAG: hypothetical protein DHS20C18_28500 [Saprospiraceae bacterium]|nr:MAG: hypothetical protein DHS20C18_28500 [Saprospiraceae bacterium]
MAGPVLAQQISLIGQVSIHNSKYNTGQIEYVKDVYVSAPFTNPDDTDDNGTFNLVFVGISEGTSVKLNIEKAGLEVVNKRDIQDVVIGRRTPVKIYLAVKGQLAKAQTELYNISLKTITTRHDRIISELRKQGRQSETTIAELEQKLNRTIANRDEAEDLLNEQLESLKKRLPGIALELASVNLDFASKMYRQAYEYFKVGEIEKAIETLDESKLDAEAMDVVNNIENLDTSIINLEDAKLSEEQRMSVTIKKYHLKAISFLDAEQYLDAIEQYEPALALLEKNKKGRHQQLANVYWETADVYQKLGASQKALQYQQKSVEVNEAFFGENHRELLPYYQTLSMAFYQNDDLNNAINYSSKAFETSKTINAFPSLELDAAKARLAELHEIRGSKYQAQEEYADAITDFQRALELQPFRKDLKKAIKKLKPIIRK